MKLESFFPEGYRLDILSDLIGFINSTTDGLWIRKPHGSNCGKGIEMVGNVQALRDRIISEKREKIGKYYTKAMFSKKKLKENTEPGTKFTIN